MKERPILFSAPMVSAMLAGSKTQTRRAVKPQPSEFWSPVVGHYHPTKVDRYGEEYPGDEIYGASDEEEGRVCPYGAPRDQLWVRENGWQRPERSARDMREGADTWAPYYYDADGYTSVDGDQFKAWGFKRRPSIHMPRWASRINLEITGVRVERLQDISEDDAGAEGVTYDPDLQVYHVNAAVPCNSAKDAYACLWDKINGQGAWHKNPWVWVIEFQKSEPLHVVEAVSLELATIE